MNMQSRCLQMITKYIMHVTLNMEGHLKIRQFIILSVLQKCKYKSGIKRLWLENRLTGFGENFGNVYCVQGSNWFCNDLVHPRLNKTRISKKKKLRKTRIRKR